MSRDEEFPRRLATVLSADIAGYTRLTELDEAGTHTALRESLSFLADAVRERGGKVAHFAGDAILAEFPTVINALNCAVTVQQMMREGETGSSDSERLQFRIGINVGDVIADRGEIYGDTVNTTVRLQALAKPGGICVSEAVRNAVGMQSPVAYEFLGEQRLKNISVPVRAYRVLLETLTSPEPPANPGGKPAVAVLPLEDLGGERKHADELTEDIIRELSRFHGIVVIAHSSTFTYKDHAVKVQEVGEELSVEYVVEGYVDWAIDRLRVSVQLVETVTGHHVWSERYDREIRDAFAAQDEIVRRIASTLAGRLHAKAGEAALRRAPEQLRVYDHVLRGQALVGKGRDSNACARTHYQRALACEATNARAHAGIALSLIDDWWNGWTEDAQETLALAINAAKSAYSADTTDSKVLWVLGLTYLLQRERGRATHLLDRAIELNPNDADAYAVHALVSSCLGQPKGGYAAMSTAMMLNPFPSAWYRWILGVLHFSTGELEAAEQFLIEAIDQNSHLAVAREYLAATYVERGKTEAGRREVGELLLQNPGITAESVVARLTCLMCTDHSRLVNALRAAGLPDVSVDQSRRTPHHVRLSG